MKKIKSIKNFLKFNRTKEISNINEDPLREFVYLDEVSVYSLLSSKQGAIDTQFTETQARTSQGDISGSSSANIGIVKAEYNSRFFESRSHESQILRKSIIQSQFKSLYAKSKDKIIVEPIDSKKIPIIDIDNSLYDQLANIQSDLQNWLIDSKDISRGQLLELEVQLEAEPIFQISAILSTLYDIFEENPELVGLENFESLLQVKAIDRVLEKLLFGLVPIRGKVIDYSVLEFDGKSWIAHSKLLQQVANIHGVSIHPLFLVGVAEKSLFWKDIRRILFSHSKYRVFCRIAQDNIQNLWTPVKLIQVLETIEPNLAKQINSIDIQALKRVSKTQDELINTESYIHVINALTAYAELIAEMCDSDSMKFEINEIEEIARNWYSEFNTHMGKLNAFNAVRKIILDRTNKEIPPYILAQFRELALQKAGLDFLGKPSTRINEIPHRNDVKDNDRFIDSEIVAIYW